MEIPNDEITVEEIRPEADLMGADLSDAELRNANLSNAELSDSVLVGANLFDAILTDAVIGNSDLTNADLMAADLTNAFLAQSNLSKVHLAKAHLENANLDGATLKKAELGDTNLNGAFLPNAELTGAIIDNADLSGTDLRDANLRDADLRNADLSGADLAGADLTNADLRGTYVSTAMASRGTQCGRLVEIEKEASTPSDWDEIARVYHGLKSMFTNSGLTGRARHFHILERRARGLEARAAGGLSGWSAYVGSLASWYLTGYGVRVSRIAVVAGLLFCLATAWYASVGIENSVYYSVVTFTTSPPWEPPEDVFTQTIAMIETYFGTLLIVLLGYVLGNREQF